MPKMKTNKAVAKRIKVTGTGKLMRHRQGKSHLLSSKTAKRRRHLRQATLITGTMAKGIKRALQG
ncbi:MAG: 50S ribosomal protein L35 [Candidatus Brocadiia bacterium]